MRLTAKCSADCWDDVLLQILGSKTCAECGGSGQPIHSSKGKNACNCVYRRVFRDVYARYREISSLVTGNHQGWRTVARIAEFRADFEGVARGVLTPYWFQIFRSRFVLGVNYSDIARVYGLPPAYCQNLLYRIESVAGQAYAELTPHSLYPHYNFKRAFRTIRPNQPVPENGQLAAPFDLDHLTFGIVRYRGAA